MPYLRHHECFLLSKLIKRNRYKFEDNYRIIYRSRCPTMNHNLTANIYSLKIYNYYHNDILTADVNGSYRE